MGQQSVSPGQFPLAYSVCAFISYVTSVYIQFFLQEAIYPLFTLFPGFVFSLFYSINSQIIPPGTVVKVHKFIFDFYCPARFGSLNEPNVFLENELISFHCGYCFIYIFKLFFSLLLSEFQTFF